MALDPRASTLADIVTGYSVDIQKGDVLAIRHEDVFQEYADLIARTARARGAEKINFITHTIVAEQELVRSGSQADLEAEAARRIELIDPANKVIRIDATSNSQLFDGLPDERVMAFRNIVYKPVVDRMAGSKEFQAKRWCMAAYPTEDGARNARMTYQQYANFVFGATNIDWRATKERQQHIKEVLDAASHIRVYVPEQTDLELSIEGRGAHNCHGLRNLPDGEIYYGPLENKTNGFISFSYPQVYSGKQVEGLTLRFENGSVVAWDAKKNKSFMDSVFEHPGNRVLGEFGIGCNYGIQDYTKDLLFDEKIGGTVHFALGESYAELLSNGGGLNFDATVHWDLVCELRKNTFSPGGELYADGRLVQKDGSWLL